MNGAPRVVIVTINNDEYLYSRVATDSVLASNNRLTRRGPNRDFIDRPPLISAAELDQYEHRVIDTFPLTLADLLPEGCEAFRFTQRGWNLTSIAFSLGDSEVWEITGWDGDFTSLTDLQRELNVDLTSVVPLELRTHPDYVEARR